LILIGHTQDIEIALQRIIAIYARDNSLKRASKADFDLIKTDNDPFIKFMASYYILYQTYEMNIPIDPKEYAEYELFSQKIPKSMLKMFGKELDKVKEGSLKHP
jgi:hypothetical protein